MVISGIEVSKLADYLEGRAETLSGMENRRNRMLMRAGAQYIRALQEELAAAKKAPAAKPKVESPPSPPAKPQVTVRRITFR